MTGRAAPYRNLALIAALSAMAAGSISAAQFTDVTATSGINHFNNLPGLYSKNGGAAAGDFNGDGKVDLFFARHAGNDLLYLNQGNGTFVENSFAAGFTQAFTSSGAAAGDIDNDGDLDIYVTPDLSRRNYLYVNNGSGQFTEVAVARGADVPSQYDDLISRFSSSFGDYDKDGYLDLYTTTWGIGGLAGTTPARLLRNLGPSSPGHFEDVTLAAGVAMEGASLAPGEDPTVTPGSAWSFSPRFNDFDGDGHPDLAIASDYGTSQLFWSNGDGTFTNGTAAANVGTDSFGMGSTVGDFNGDGLLDWYVTSIYGPDIAPSQDGNRLYMNNGDRTFTDVTDAAGVRDTGWGWGAAFFDADNDGDEDLIATNGYPVEADGDVTTFFLNNGDGTFTNTSSASGIDDNDYGTGLLTFDYDNDGDLDVLVMNGEAAPTLYRNDSDNSNGYLRIDLEGTESNSMGIGALITVDPDTSVVGDEMIREVSASTHYLAQSEITAHFGLGALAGTIDQITIDWPLGQTTTLNDVAPNQLLVVTEGSPADLSGDGDVDDEDIGLYFAAFTGPDQGPSPDTRADLSGDGDVDDEDLGLAFGQFTGPLAPVNVPEPASSVLLMMAGVLVLKRSRR